MSPFIRIQDLVDIIIISVLVYQLYRWFRTTRALQVVIGLGFLGLLYLVTKSLGLFMTSWILQELGTVLFVLIIVIFQDEIRQALYRVSLLRHGLGRQEKTTQLDLCDCAETIFALARARTGALLVIQRRESLDDYLQHGVLLDAMVTPQLLKTIFQPGTSLHDGAVIIRSDRIVRAACHLPLATQSHLPEGYGTRHRAALGLSERTDAVVLVVSEERGAVSLAVGQELQPVDSPGALQETLVALLQPLPGLTPETLRRGVFQDLRAKGAVVLLVILSWLVLTVRQGEIITVSAPVRYKNLAEKLTLQRSSPEEVDVQLKVLSSLIPSPKQLDIVAELDLAQVHEGANQLAIRPEDIKLPVGVKISQIKPSIVKVTVAKRARRQLPVRVVMTGTLPGRMHVRKVKAEPAVVTVEGPEQLIGELDFVNAEEVDVSGVRQSVVLERAILPPSPQVKVVGDGHVKVRLTLGN